MNTEGEPRRSEPAPAKPRRRRLGFLGSSSGPASGIQAILTLGFVALGWWTMYPVSAARVEVPAGSDMGWHMMNAASLFWVLQHDGLGAVMAEALAWQDRYPCLVYLAALPFMVVEGTGHAAALGSLVFWWSLLVISLGVAGRVTWGPAAGLAAAFVGGASPAALGARGQFLLDLPCTAMVAAGLATLALARGFSWLPGTLLFASVFGFACLTRSTASWFLAWPALVVAWRSWHGWRLADRGAALAAVLALLFAAWILAGPGAPCPALAAPRHAEPGLVLPGILAGWLVLGVSALLAWHLPAGPLRNGVVGLVLFLAIVLPFHWASRSWLADVVSQLPLPLDRPGPRYASLLSVLEGVPFGPWLLAGAGLAVAARRRWAEEAPAWCGLSCGALMVYLLSPSADRYALPLLPFLVLLATGWLTALPRVGAWMAGGLLVLALVPFLAPTALVARVPGPAGE